MMNFVTFNQDYSHLAVGTSRGFRIFTTEPFAKVYECRDAGNVALLEMLFSTSLVALILSPRRLQIKNTKRDSVICELTFPTSILAVRLNRKRLVVVLEDQIYLYDIQTMKLLYTIETSPNPVPICALSPSSDNCYLAYPLPQKSVAAGTAFALPAHAPPSSSTHIAPTTGEVLIFDTVKLEAINVVDAHRSPLSCIAFNSEGSLLATASDKGTIIRVFSVPEAQKLYQFRRGSMPSRIFSLSFNITSTLLCVSSATETIHIFKLGPRPQPANHSSSSSPALYSSGAALADGKARSASLVSSSFSHRRISQDNSDTLASSQLYRHDKAGSDKGGDDDGEDDDYNNNNHIGGDDEDEDEETDGSPTSMTNRKPNGTFMGLIRRTSQNVSSSLATTVGGYLPKGVAEMWEPARDFAWIRLPRSSPSSSSGTANMSGGAGAAAAAGGGVGGAAGNGGGGSGGGSSGFGQIKSVVAMSPHSAQVMVVTNEGNFYVFAIDLAKGGEASLIKQYSYVESEAGGRGK